MSVDFAETEYLYKTAGEEKNIVTIKLTGKRNLDDKLANELSGIKLTDEIQEGYTWHHLDDYNPVRGTCTMQLVEFSIHQKACPHFGSVKLIEDLLKISSTSPLKSSNNFTAPFLSLLAI